MSVYRHAARTDANQTEIEAALRAVGAGVWYIRWPFDLLVGFRGRLYLVECKVPGEKLNAKQQVSRRVLEACGSTVAVVYDVDEALAAIGAQEEKA